MNLARQQVPGSQVWSQTTQSTTQTTTTTIIGTDPNADQPYTTPVTSGTYGTGTLTSTVGSPTSTFMVEPLDGGHTGDGTFYTPSLGACGKNNTEGDPIAAVSYLLFDYFPGSTTSNPNSNPICGKKLVAHYTDPATQQQTTTQEITIVDRCAGCEIRWSVDFSPSVFSTLASQTLGRINITWSFVGEIGGETLAVPNAGPVQRELPREEDRTSDMKKRLRRRKRHREIS
ncbi:RlpA-like double-psi beta-barrel-protein domain-containing protein-containing protein [Desarmillaria ectypa]|nr:RlpA-like double-psi beta-barrel-protein domain-containing protein-containing protein [Desarmillaria ectypa]